MKIANHDIGPGHPCFITAEIGINHGGSIETAKKLIDVAAFAGCQAVKFQKRTVETVYSRAELDRPRESPFGTTNRDLKIALEFDLDAYRQIDSYCREKKIIWFASPWDTESVDFLAQFDIPVYKVASACITDLELLHRIALQGKPVIVSTGMSTLDEIATAVNILRMYTEEIALLACVSTYPAKLEELNLLRIHTLRLLYPQYAVGYSGHEIGLYSTLSAVAMGACIVERHITLDRASWGSDQAASVEPQGLLKLVREIRDLEKARGNGEIGMLESEKPVMEKLRRIK